MKHTLPQHNGFVILFTILTASIIMVIGLGIYSIASREAVLSGTARESQMAFYAADAGLECALYAQALANQGTTYPPAAFQCGTTSVTMVGTGTSTDPFTFSIIVDPAKNTCAKVNVFNITAPALGRRIISQGYNICNTTPAIGPMRTSPILVERDIDASYTQ